MSSRKNIVVGIDISESSLEVLKRAFQLARLKNAELTIVHAINKSLFETYFFNSSNDEELIDKAKTKIEEKIDKLQEVNVKYLLEVKIASPVNLITEISKKIDASLVIVGVNEADNFISKVLGSTSIKIIQNTNLPVLIVKNSCISEYNKILAFTDLSSVSQKSINFTQDFFENSSIKVIHAYKQLNDFVLTYHNSIEVKEEIQKEIIEKSKEKFEEFKRANKIIEGEIIEVYHGVGEVLSNTANEQKRDLVVIGSKGVDDTNSFLYGSTALYMMEKVDSDILIYVPSKEEY